MEDMFLIDILSDISLEVLFDIVDYLKFYSHDIDDFKSTEFELSEVKEVLKEEFLRVNLFIKLQNYYTNNLIHLGNEIVRWKKFIVEKEYPKHPKLKCDIFLKGQIAQSSPVKIVYKKEQYRDIWIEVKFIRPQNDNYADLIGNITRDFLIRRK